MTKQTTRNDGPQKQPSETGLSKYQINEQTLLINFFKNKPIMKTKYFIFAALAATVLASCTNDEFLGDTSPNVIEETTDEGAIRFGFEIPNATRADIAGPAAADLLGNNFYVTGTKGTEAATYPTDKLVFDNYLVHYTANSAGTTESNTANWEYVGVVPESSPTENYVKIGSYNSQTIKYWDYSVPQYDFFGFSTGTFAAVSGSSTGTGNIGVTAMNYGSALAGGATAYTFDIPSVAAIKSTYITDIVEVKKTDNAYGKDVTLRFKNLGSKVRVALYETVPGYQVTDVFFYAVDGTTGFSDTKSTEGATLISANTNGLPTKGTITVYFPHVGDDNATAFPQDYNKAAATVTPVTASSTKTLTFGDLDNFETTKEGVEPDNDGATPTPNAYHYIGRTLPTATFAGSEAAKYYQTVFPVSDSDPLTLRVDYKLVSIDGSNEVINVYGAKAVVPATYTKWLPNYAYTYIFKISDNTNGWTSQVSTDPQGLFPITFDAVVAEATDATGEQTTVTTVATPSITTYQQNHTYTTNEYSKGTGKNIYVQVMNNDNTTSPSLVTTLSTSNALLYEVNDDDATEAMVMDALEKRTTAIGAADVKGRNSIELTKDATNISITNEIENGVDDNKITVATNSAAKIAISGLTAPKTYAFVYDYTTGSKTVVDEFQPIAVEGSTVGESGKTYYTVTTTTLDGTTPTTTAETVDNDYIYFSKTTDGTGTTTYSYISIAGKAGMTLPAGVVKVKKNTITDTAAGGSTKVDGTFYFEKYFTNNGQYAVKVIKIVA